MPLRVGILSTAHVHTPGYVHALIHSPDAVLVGIWDDVIERAETMAQRTGVPFIGYRDDLLAAVDAVVICSENNRHAELIEVAAAGGKHVLCEKPLVTKTEDVERVERAVATSGIKLMTAFPCRFAPAYQKLKSRVQAGEIGTVRAICTTNRGRCPFGWFVEPELSGGGAMIDHVVHVTDLLRDLLGKEPARVQAQIGSNMYGKDWDDTAMLTIEFDGGVFATLDSSWSRPQNFRTWGDVTLNVVGDDGVIEVDLFGQGLAVTTQSAAHFGYGSDLDAMMVGAFVDACINDGEVPVTMRDGMQAARVSIAGYRSAASGQPELVG